MALDQSALEELTARFTGRLVLPGDAGYDDARQVHNGAIDKRPALIARCVGTADVQDAVRFAREHELRIAIRGGGHNVAGRSVCDDGLMIDLSLMNGVIVDSAGQTARAQAGVTWGAFNRETQLHSLATTGGIVSTTGVAGLTLGGGLGWLMGRFGLAVDNLRSAEVVTATGEVMRAGAAENEDLFWALRGGGGNFGVVTSFEYDLHPVGPMVTGGLIAFPFDQARQVIRNYREFTASLPDDLTAFCGLIHAPDGSGAKLAAVVVCHSGPLDEGEAAVAPVKGFGTPAMDMLGPIPYTVQNTLLDAGNPKGARNYWKSSFVDSLSDSAIDTVVGAFESAPSPMSALLFEHFHGAAVRPDATATAFPHRTKGYNLLVISEWMDSAADESNVRWAKETFSAVEQFMVPDVYVNYLDDDEREGRVSAAYGANYPRLRQIKKKYDPDNAFSLNQNIEPA